jgi:hypothetical protein
VFPFLCLWLFIASPFPVLFANHAASNEVLRFPVRMAGREC